MGKKSWGRMEWKMGKDVDEKIGENSRRGDGDFRGINDRRTLAEITRDHVAECASEMDAGKWGKGRTR
jgi:hypothetical protein